MKKFLLSVLIILFSATFSQAQFLRGVGVKVGMTISSQEWEYSIINIDPDNRTGFNAGVFAEFLDIPFFSVVGELNYVQKGISNLGGFIGADILNGDIKLNYLNISALAKLRMSFIAVSPYIVAGPKIDIELSREAFLTDLIISNFSKERVGFKVGIGTEINLVAMALLVEVLYDADFNELYQENNLTINTSSFDLRVGIMF